MLVWAVRDPESAHFRHELADLGTQVVLVSRDEPSRLGSHESWAGPERLNSERIATLLPDLRQRDVYISGSPRFVSDFRRGLKSRARHIHTDAFSGY